MKAETKAINIVIVAFLMIFLLLFIGKYTEYLSIIFGNMSLEFVIMVTTGIILLIVVTIYSLLTK
ncbi:MAG: hypothetical protein QW734_07760 [Candidatus Bathyarchaeia archaeon]